MFFYVTNGASCSIISYYFNVAIILYIYHVDAMVLEVYKILKSKQQKKIKRKKFVL